MSAHSSAVKVYVRIRPTACFAQELIKCLPDKQTVNVCLRRDSRKEVVNNQISSWSFRLDGVLHNMSQEEVFQSVAHSVVLQALEGYNGTVMCFGQTGAGKTYTMTGATESYQQRGIIPRALQEVFYEVEQRVDRTFSVFLSFLEIYNETLVDLLASVKRGRMVQSGALTVVEETGGVVSVKGLTLHPVLSEEDALNLLFEGEMNRIIGEHALNKNSSRSHCIFTIHLESRSRTLSDAPYVTSKLNLVDLAGSERLSKTGSEGQVQREALYINRSLSFLEQTIIALADRRREHVPFRQSKLTHALKDSLGGNCNTVLVANIYGEAAQIEETRYSAMFLTAILQLSTLRFATRMKCVRTQPSINERIDPALQVRRLQKEIQLLKQELFFHDTLANRAGVPYESLSDTQVEEIRSQVHRYLAGTLGDIMIVSVRQIQEVFTQFKKAVLEQEQKVKEQLSQKNSLVETSENSMSISAAKDAGPLGAVGTVGEVESGFGLGLAAPSQKHTQAPSPNKSKGKKIKENSRKDVTQALGPAEGVAVNQGGTDALTPTCKPEDREAPPADQGERKEKSEYELFVEINFSTAPCKMEAFEDFKLGQGREINRILKENKGVLLARMGQLQHLKQDINSYKRDINHMSSKLQLYKEQRQSQGQFVCEEGEPLLEEGELALLTGLREMKDRYRQKYQELLSTKAELHYCQHLVDQCRIRLLTEFESWYNESYLLPEEVQTIFNEGGPIRPGFIPVDKALSLEVDQQEQCQHLRTELLAEGPGAVSFYNAHNRTLQRRQRAKPSQS